jgi:hypothetical protein
VGVKKNICLFPLIGAVYILMNRGAIQKRDFIFIICCYEYITLVIAYDF